MSSSIDKKQQAPQPLRTYRSIRFLSHILRVLGYTKLVSLESFRKPNFRLIADILFWLCEKIEPNNEISANINGEAERVAFIRSTLTLLVSHTRINVDPIKIYYADHRAIPELYKIIEVFHKGTQSSEMDDQLVCDFSLPPKFDKRQTKELAKNITESGLKIYELLGHENVLKEKRDFSITVLETVLRDHNASGSNHDKHVKKLIEEQLKQNVEMEEYFKSLENKERDLLEKIRKKKMDIERVEKKLKSISTIKPAYVEEMERCEKELERIFQIYVDKVRNLDYLEDLYEKINIQDRDKQGQIKKYLEKMQKHIQNKEDQMFDHNIEEISLRKNKPNYSNAHPPKTSKPIIEENREEDEDYVY